MRGPRSEMQATAGSEYDAPEDYRPSDSELGVGQEDPGAAAAAVAPEALAALMERPEIRAAVDALVAERLANAAGMPPEAPAAGPNDQMAQFVSLIVQALDKHSSVHGQQQAGYVKPLPAEEVDARAAAYIEMRTLIEHAELNRLKPTYLLKAPFYAEDILWPEGDTIFWLGAPNTEMEPQNDVARRISDQMWRWIGGEQALIEDQVADAMRERSGRIGSTAAPETPEYRAPAMAGRVGHVAGVERQNVRPRRAAGTLVPENPTAAGYRGIIGTVQPGDAPSPLQSH